MELNGGLLRKAFGTFPSGVTAVAALIDGCPVGLTASSFTSVSLEPPLVSVCFMQTSGTWRVLRRAHHVGVSVLAADHVEVAQQLASRTGDRFADLNWQADARGAVLISGAGLWLTCSLESEVPAGDHTVALLRVEDLQVFADVQPLVFHGSTFRQLSA